MNDGTKPVKTQRPRGLGRVYLRGITWWVDFQVDRRRYRMPADGARTEKQAWDFLNAERARARRGARLDLEQARFGDLVGRLQAHHEAKGTRARTWTRYQQQLAHLEAFFGNARVKHIVGRAEAYVAHRRRGAPDARPPVPGAKPASIHGEMALLVHMFLVAGLPRPAVPAVEVRNVRTGFLELGDVQAVAEYLPAPLAAAVWFSYYTGWRKGEVLGLRWKAVDFEAGIVRLEPGETKSGRGRVFPFAVHPGLAALLQAVGSPGTELEFAL